MDVQRGMIVAGPDGRIGVVSDVVYEADSTPARIIVQRDDGQAMVLHPGSYHVDAGVVRLNALQESTSGTMTQPIPARNTGYETRSFATTDVQHVQAGGEVVIPVIQEEINVAKRQVEGGGVRVNKRIEEHEETVEQPIFREEVTVERVPIGRTIETAPEARQEGDTLIIPVVEEMLVVEKRLVLKEEVRVQKRRVQETEQARVVVRAEKVDIEQIPDPTLHRTVGDQPVA
ncbi:MAG: YsnF/AvaK domain-containing protein [Herpetosiphonaceae bacterium]|nr:YsnF/AvaK domain-containing protein [Herpetosiphonaceae bacterium]